MTTTELITLVASLVGVFSLVFVVRRAALKSAKEPHQLPSKQESSSNTKGGEFKRELTPVPFSTPPPKDSTQESDRLREGLEKTRKTGFISKLGKIFSKKRIDELMLEELEEVLYTADIGPKTANRLFSSIRENLSKDNLSDSSMVWQNLREESAKILEVDLPPLNFEQHRPFVLLVLGVNGVGKTTTIGKVAAKLQSAGKSVLLAAGDTFRAAATEQLEVWGERTNSPVVKGKSSGDPSSVIFDAIKRGQEENVDVVICDTAGRLHTKVDLMDELKKIGRVIDKAMPGAPHETWLVLDSTTGQNAISQAEIFKEAMNITGIVLTKLDGTAKGGVVLGICDTLSVPIRYIGVGEQIDDLREFNPNAFIDALYAKDAD